MYHVSSQGNNKSINKIYVTKKGAFDSQTDRAKENTQIRYDGPSQSYSLWEFCL